MSEMIIKSPDPKSKKLHDFEFKSSTGITLMGATLCYEDGDSIEFSDDEIRIVRIHKPTQVVSGAVERYTIYLKDVAAIRELEFEKIEPTLEQALELKRLIEDQYYANRTDLRPE